MPLFDFCRMLSNSWTILAPSRSQSQGNYLTNTSPFSPSYITRMRSFTSSAHSHYPNGQLLPVYMNVSSFELETMGFNSKNSSSSLSKQFLGYFQAALTLFQIMFSSPSGSSQDPSPLFGVAMVIAFAAFLSGNFLSQSKPRLAAIVERIGCFGLTMGFSVMTTTAFPSGSLAMRIIGWLAGAGSMLAFLRSCLA